MLHQSIFVAPNSLLLASNIINLPEIRKYVENWGKEGDFGYVAVDNESGAGVVAIWLRFFDFNNKGYGYIGDSIPEIGIIHTLPLLKNIKNSIDTPNGLI